MTLWMFVLGAMVGCGSSTPEPPAEAAAARSAKTKGKMKGRKGKARRRRAKAPEVPPVGAAGEVLGELVLTKTEEPAGKPKTPPTVEVAAETEDTAMVIRTNAELKLSWGTDGAQTVGLGKVLGTCAESETRPVGPPGKEKTPLWAVRCQHGDRTIDLFILQIGPRLSVVREVSGKTPEAPATYKPVKRIPLVLGAKIKRDS